ncbi:MAG: pyridoxal-phosphate dependent enzyme [Gemmatimonadetes bacterium]|nr:pyridoxal-phosphate dependent enzyme [Gemmatimonadota bacterium]
MEEALGVVRGLVPPTPLLRAPALDALAGVGVHLKLESLQVTGSFKVRGAAAHVAALDPEVRARGVVTCSSGNHGRAVAWVARRMGLAATVFVPSWVDPSKRAAIAALGASVDDASPTYDEAEARAMAEAESSGRAYVSPFDDPWVVAGQGTVALEILDQLPGVASVVVPLSGGGLAGGVAQALWERRSGARVVAASARNARVMWESVRAGRPVTLEEKETLASALAGGIGPDNRWTFPLVRGRVDRHVVVDEEAIARAMAFAALRLHLVVEGGGAVGLASLLEGTLREHLDPTGPAVLVVSGGNVDGAVLAGVVERAGGAPDEAGG